MPGPLSLPAGRRALLLAGETAEAWIAGRPVPFLYDEGTVSALHQSL